MEPELTHLVRTRGLRQPFWCAKLALADRERAGAGMEARMVSHLRSHHSRECHLTTLTPGPVRHDHLPEQMNVRFHLDFRG